MKEKETKQENTEMKDSLADFVIDSEAAKGRMQRVEPIASPLDMETRRQVPQKEDTTVGELRNCLSNRTVIARFIPKRRSSVEDPNHELYGGMATNAKVYLTVPQLRNGGYVDVLTKAEKDFLEDAMGLEHNALSVHRKDGNFWSDANPTGIGSVALIKGDTPFDLSKPLDYIRYKVVLANKDIVCPSMRDLQDRPKATYRFVIVDEAESAKGANLKVNLKAKAYMVFGRISNDTEKMRLVIETLDGKKMAPNTKAEYLQARVGELIESNTKMFIHVATDPDIDTKVMLRKAVEKGVVTNRGGYLYLKQGNVPLCGDGQEPTLSNAAAFINHPRNQEVKFAIEAGIKQ